MPQLEKLQYKQICKECGRVLIFPNLILWAAFHNSPYCKDCRKIHKRHGNNLRTARYRTKHPERVKACRLSWYTRNREHALIVKHANYVLNREQRLEYARWYRQTHRPQAAAWRRKDRATNPEKYREKERAYYRKNRKRIIAQRLERYHRKKRELKNAT